MRKSQPQPQIQLDPDLDGLANALRKKYAEAKTAQMGRRYSPAARFKSIAIWYGVARKCLELTADPDDFIEAAFLYCSIPGGPYPQNLASRAMDRWYGEMLSLVGKEPLAEGETIFSRRLRYVIRDTVNASLRIARANNMRLRDVLNSPTLMDVETYPSYVRLALLPKDPEVVRRWSNSARAELRINARLLKTLQAIEVDLSWL